MSRRNGIYVRSTIDPGDDDPRHGSVNGYSNLNCRCARCRSAWAKSVADKRCERGEQGLTSDDPRHGDANTYTNYRCRCDACTAEFNRVRTAQKRRVSS